jgi:hypothetical protein
MLDRRLALEIFQLDADAGRGAHLLFAVTTDIAFALQHIEHAGTQLRARGQDGVLLRALSVADAGEHITQGIGQSHRRYPYQLDFVTPGIRPLLARSRS